MAGVNGPIKKPSSSGPGSNSPSNPPSPAVQINRTHGSPPVGLNVQCSSSGSNPGDNGSSLLERFFPSPTSNNRYKKVCTLDCESCRHRIKQLIREESNLMPYECLSAPCSRKSSQACDGKSWLVKACLLICFEAYHKLILTRLGSFRHAPHNSK